MVRDEGLTLALIRFTSEPTHVNANRLSAARSMIDSIEIKTASGVRIELIVASHRVDHDNVAVIDAGRIE